MKVSELAQTINDLPQDYDLECVVKVGSYGENGYDLTFLKDNKNKIVILQVDA